MPKEKQAIIPSKKVTGERVRALRVHRGLTQLELAKQLGTTQSNISEMERGLRGLTLQQLMKATRVLGATTDEILFGGVLRDDKPKLSLKVLRRVHRIEELAPTKQRAILEVIDALLDKHSASSSNGSR